MGAFAGLLGMRRIDMEEGRSRFALTVGPAHMNPHGVAHGGVLYALADYAMGGALTSRLERGERCATLEVKIQYVAPVTAGELRAEAAVVERTRRIGIVEARVYTEGDRLVALATGMFYISARPPA